MKNLQQQQEAS